MKRKNILLILTLLLDVSSAKVMAYDALVDGIYYDLYGTTATVTCRYNDDSNKDAYIGHVIIPEKFSYGGKQYSVTSIGYYAFRNCSGLTSITIGNSVTSIGGSAFYGCSGLTSITVDGGNTVYDSRNNCNAIIKKATNTLIVGCKNTIIPNSVTSIGGSAFYGCSGLTSITISNSVTSIGGSAFYGCTGLTSVTIPNSVTSIGSLAFQNCTSLISITIPNSVTSIGGSAFSGCSGLTSITIPNSVTSIGSYAFSGCTGLTSVTIPNSVASIENGVFAYCKYLLSVTIPNSVTSIGKHAFFNCAYLASIDIPNSVTSIGEGAFCGCSLTDITIPNSVTSIERATFQWCNITNIIIPTSVTSIGESAFNFCSYLTSVMIPNSIKIIGNEAFSNCNRLASFVMCKEEPISINSNVFSSVANTTLYVPKSSKALYSNTEVWKDFKVITEFPTPDANGDGYVDVVDVVDIVRYIVGTSSLPFISVLADLNQDKTLSVADAVLVVKEIVGETNWTRRFNGVSDNRGALTLTCNDDRSLSLCMEDEGQYTAFQFDLMVPEDGDVQMQLNTLRRQGHQLIYNKVGDGHYRVVALSLNNNSFSGQQGEVLNIQLDGLDGRSVTLDNIHFVTLRGTDHRFDALSAFGATTGVQGASAREHGASAVYRLDGTKQKDSQRGVNIMKGKKYIRK